ncbi:phosphoribosylglycinamide formyltransferase 2, partial [Francisella tularensis subsp. holarctica]|nr:phosphoribosylglycinamide formyltransferase 2 [Francisella tularensis subsp. holarctica]
ELHLRAIVGLPIPDIQTLQPSASAEILLEGDTANASICGIDKALADANLDIRIFSKTEILGIRRMGVVLAKAQNPHIA